MALFLLFIASALAWIVSTIGAGGSSMLMVPIVLFLVGPLSLPQILSLNSLISIPYRLFLFGKFIDWKIVTWSVPAMIIGPFFGAYTFSITQADIFQFFLGLFLITYVLQEHFFKRPISFAVKNWYFFPAYLITGFISGLIGAVGPIMNILYLQKNMDKEAIIGTKTMNVLVGNITKISTYAYFGSMTSNVYIYGLITGFGGIVGITIGKQFLSKITYLQFKKIVLFLMLISGVMICIKGAKFWLI